jgi:hypothetical protein
LQSGQASFETWYQQAPFGLIAIRLGVFEFRKERAEPRLFMADAVTLELQPPPISRANLLYSHTVSRATGRLDENKLILLILWRFAHRLRSPVTVAPIVSLFQNTSTSAR